MSQGRALCAGFRGSRRSIVNEFGDVADLLPDEQSELALKLRYGIGLEQLGVTPLASVTSARAPVQLSRAHREPDAGTHARAAALGITAGARGQWLRR